MSLRTRIGALIHDWPRFEFAIHGWPPYGNLRFPWVAMRNRDETLTLDGTGARCEWRYTSDLHIAKVFPASTRRLMRRALRDWPIEFCELSPATDRPDVSFIIGHRGLARLPHLLATLRSIAAQRGVAVECLVIEQSATREIENQLPPWVRYIHTPIPSPEYGYNRSWTLNVGARHARGSVLVLHDNDMLCPSGYAAEALRLVRAGWSFLELKRFTFYLDEEATLRFFENGKLVAQSGCRVVQNAQGASIGVARDAFVAIGGFDESFVGWGGEDNEFWHRAESRGDVFAFGFLPFVHVWHPPQAEKLDGAAAAGSQRFLSLEQVAPETRIERLRALDWGDVSRPSSA
jgi:hypothetical protein